MLTDKVFLPLEVVEVHWGRDGSAMLTLGEPERCPDCNNGLGSEPHFFKLSHEQVEQLRDELGDPLMDPDQKRPEHKGQPGQS